MRTVVYHIFLLCIISFFLYQNDTKAQTINMPTSNSSYYVASGKFYDDGGSGSSYSTSYNSTVTFYPAVTGMKVRVKFNSFATESATCGQDYDRLFIHDGNSTAATALHPATNSGGYWTGCVANAMSVPLTITSTAADGSLTFRFKSDAGTTAAGWDADISLTGSPCGGTFYDMGGPSANYSSSQTYTFTLTPGAGQSISLNFSAFATESASCATNYDWIKIYNGNSTAAALIDCYSTGGVVPGTITSTAADGTLTITFKSDGGTNAAGWTSTVSCISACSGTPTAGTTSISSVSGPNNTNFTLSNAGASSGGGISYQWQSSPDNSVWTNIGGATSTSLVTSSNLAITYYRLVTTCSNGGATATSNVVSYTVTSWLQPTGSGTLSITTCSGTLYDNGGSGSDYTANQAGSTLTIYPATAGSKVQLVFSSFVTESASCATNYDWLKIYNGNSTGASLINCYSTGGNIPGTILSSAADGSLTLYFKSDGTPNGAGWAATISCLSPCSGTPTAGTTSISSSSGPNNTNFTLSNAGATTGPGITYQWQSSPDNSVWTNIGGATSTSLVTLSNIAIQYYRMVTTCSNGGATATSNPVSYTVTSWLQPQDNGTNSITTCSGTYYDPGGTGNYGDDLESTLTIYPGTAGTVVSVTFTAYALENCACDYLRIHDGNNTGAATIGTYYNTNPGTITSTAADGSLTFYFDSDNNTNTSGWTATISCITPTIPNCANYVSPADGLEFCTTPATLTWSAPSSGFAPSGYKLYLGSNNPPTNLVNGTNLGNVLTYTTGALVSGTTYFWKVIPTNIAGDATNCALQSFTRSSCVNIFNGSATTCSSEFYDSGGPSGSTSDNSNLVFTYCPSTAGTCIKTNFYNFQTEAGYDLLYVYDGNSIAAPPISGSPFSGNLSPFSIVGTSSNPTGCLTFKFISDASTRGNGWKSTVTCGTCGAGFNWSAQDCYGGITVCSDQSVAGNSLGDGDVSDLNSTNRGCLSTEHQSSWYLFSPATAGGIELAIIPANGSDDYDFAIWGPMASISCIPAVAPYRCSYSDLGGSTGLVNGAGDNSEGVGGNKWVNKMNVLAGEKYIMLIDNYSVSSQPYTLDWTLTAGATLNCALLSIDLLSFKGVNKENYNLLAWTTESEMNNDRFELESSIDGKSFKVIGTVKGAGNSKQTLNYSYKDKAINNLTYYRLKQIDFDGKSTYSDVIKISKEDYLITLDLFPNPANDNVNVNIGLPYDGNVKVVIADVFGRVLQQEEFIGKTGEITKNYNIGNIEMGVYMVQVFFNERLIQTKKLLKN